MDPSVLYRIFLPVLFALIVLPLILRFLIGHIVFGQVQKRHMRPLLDDLIENDKDREALKAFRDFLRGKINTPFISNLQVKEDLKTILLAVQNAYCEEEGDEPRFSFSVSDLIKCFFLLMNDLNDMWKGSRRVERISRSRISTFLRINRLSGYYNIIYEKLPFLKLLRKGRITGKMVRILLIPLIGLPSILISIIASLISLFLTEIIWRHYYSVFLIRCFSYILILYGDRESVIGSRLKKFSNDQIREEARKIEELINPENGLYRSTFFEEAYVLYQKTLDEYGVSPEKDLDFNGVAYKFNGKRKLIKRLLHIPLRVVDQYNPLSRKEGDDRGQLANLIRTIASPYNNGERFYSSLRVIDLFDSLYMISLLGYSRIIYGSFLLDSISVDFALTAKNISDEIVGEMLKSHFPGIRKAFRSYKLYRKSRFLYRAVRSGNAAGLILSVSGPIAFESVRTVIRDYIYRRAGRMTLYCYECNQLKKKRLFDMESLISHKDDSRSSK